MDPLFHYDRPLLALETSGNSLGVALCAKGVVVFEENVTEGMIHGRALAPLMQKALAAHNLKSKDLCAVAVSQGPGSWTGLRIGISAAKAFAWAAGLPVICVPSFEALAFDAAERFSAAHAVLTLRDARSEGFFAAVYDMSQSIVPLLHECVLKPADVVEAAKRLCKIKALALSVCGDEKCLAQLAPDIAANGWTALPELQHISARGVALCGWAHYCAGEVTAWDAAEIHALGPLYLRASDPELKLARVPSAEC